MSEPPAFGDLLRRARLAAGLTQEALAERAGISPRGMGYIERGISRAPQRATVALLAEALDLTGDDRLAFEAAARRLAARGAVPPTAAPPSATRPSADQAPAAVLAAPIARLPVPLTSFIGRERELAEVRRLLGTTRLLTLTGAGGVGKTRLALEVARAALADYPQGVWLVELAALADGGLVAGTVAQALGVPEQPDRAPIEVLTAWLRDRHLLLVVDNCEHLLDACAHLLATLLASCPGLRLLTTSRETLGIDGELTWRVPSLALPDATRTMAAELAEVAAVRLFAERAAFAQPGFVVMAGNAAAVAEICVRLDGIPLALELAAARLRALPVEQVAGRLTDRFRLLTGGSRAALPRQQTLRATIDWSHELLSAPEQAVFRRLAVFAGGWTIEAAEAVCSGAGIDEWAVLELLARLADKSMVQFEVAGEGEARYGLLETVRQYAWERLAEVGEAGMVRDRHAAWCLALAERADPELRSHQQLDWFRRLDAERDNLRAALAWYQEREPAAGLRLVSNLYWYWMIREMTREGRQWLETFLGQAPEPTVARARALHGLALMGHNFDSLERFEAPLRLARQLGATSVIVWVLRDLALGILDHLYQRHDRGEVARARALLEEGLTLSRTLRDHRHIGVTLLYLGLLALHDDEVEQAHAWFDEGLQHLRQVGDRWALQFGIWNLARVAMAQRRFDQATVLLYEGVGIAQEIGKPIGIIQYWSSLARVALLHGELEEAQVHTEAILALAREFEVVEQVAIAQRAVGDVVRRRGDLVRAAALLKESLVHFVDFGEQSHTADVPGHIVEIAAWLDQLALVALDRQHFGRAVRWLGAAAAAGVRVAGRLDAFERAELDEAAQAARTALGEGVFATAWAEGQALSPDQAVAEALAEEADRG